MNQRRREKQTVILRGQVQIELPVKIVPLIGDKRTTVQLSTGESLTATEKRVLQGILECKLNKEIAAEINKSLGTVKFHVSNLLAKFGVKSRNELGR